MNPVHLFRLTRLINRLLWPFLLLGMGVFWLVSRKSRPHFRERLGLSSPGRNATTTHRNTMRSRILFHLASLGEAHAAIPLINDLSQNHSLSLTTTTLSGRAALQRRFPDIPVSLAPIDLPDLWEPFLKSRGVSGIILFETEIWPVMLLTAYSLGIHVAVVNGRLSPRGADRMRRFGFLFRTLVKPMNPILVQSSSDRDRYILMGASSEQILVTGNLKWDLPDHPGDRDLSRHLEEWLRNGETSCLSNSGKPFRVLLSSVHPDESRKMLKAIRAKYSRPLHIILAPRHLDRLPEFRESLAQFQTVRERSLHHGSLSGRPDSILVSVLDTYGELRMLPSLCQMAVIGGTFEPVGGHSPVEAARAGIPLVVGPNIDHIRDLVQTLEEGGGILRLETTDDLPVWIERFMNSECDRLELGQRAKTVSEGQREARQKTHAGLQAFLLRSETGAEGRSRS
ncbi:MAG: 3-deoxy-D-manno-octulosonic acid transferase [Leptospirales bacterium]